MQTEIIICSFRTKSTFQIWYLLDIIKLSYHLLSLLVSFFSKLKRTSFFCLLKGPQETALSGSDSPPSCIIISNSFLAISRPSISIKPLKNGTEKFLPCRRESWILSKPLRLNKFARSWHKVKWRLKISFFYLINRNFIDILLDHLSKEVRPSQGN